MILSSDEDGIVATIGLWQISRFAAQQQPGDPA
jgi:hypothetical protein